MRVLIVEDDPIARKIISLYLIQGGHEVVEAENGLEALEKVGTTSVDLIITDLNMPYMDGIELIKYLKENPTYQKIPVILISTEAGDREKQKAIDVGAEAYLTKPLTSDLLLRTIEDLQHGKLMIWR